MKDIYILCAAIWYDDEKPYYHQPKNINTGLVVCGYRHHNCILLAHQFIETKDGIEGFLTSDNTFVTREVAYNIAEAAGQIKGETYGRILYSENIY